MMPNLGSLLLDNLAAANPLCTGTDARDQARPFNTDCDIGAVEAQAGEAV